MNTWESLAIRELGKRSYVGVLLLTTFIALAGAWAEIHKGGLLWGMWIPLCFLVIPVVHHLCKKMIEMEQRLARLEGNNKAQPAGGAYVAPEAGAPSAHP